MSEIQQNCKLASKKSTAIFSHCCLPPKIHFCLIYKEGIYNLIGITSLIMLPPTEPYKDILLYFWNENPILFSHHVKLHHLCTSQIQPVMLWHPAVRFSRAQPSYDSCCSDLASNSVAHQRVLGCPPPEPVWSWLVLSCFSGKYVTTRQLDTLPRRPFQVDLNVTRARSRSWQVSVPTCSKTQNVNFTKAAKTEHLKGN